MKRRVLAGSVATATALASFLAIPSDSASAATATTEFTVVADDGVSAAAAVAAISAAGGRVVSRNDEVGTFRVVTTEARFAARVAASPALIGASADRPVGYAPKAPGIEDLAGGGTVTTAAHVAGPIRPDTLDSKLWGLKMIRADRARLIEAGDHGVTVGVLDTGVDASNPDIAVNFNWRLSRNFAPDLPDIDGPCEATSCVDAVGTDDGGHGTHVAGTIGAAANGTGVSGVAPGVSLVELKGGQDSGYFFLDPVVNALTYAGDNGIDVVNMSFYLDPWLYNCADNPADAPAAQAEQRAIVTAMTRALDYAHRHGVTLVAALGNEHTDLGFPGTDATSPDYPADAAYDRTIDNQSCLSMPTEGPHVIGVSALGPTTTKAAYSNYGLEQISLAAPGGWTQDGFGTPTFNTVGNNILSSYPEKVLQEAGRVDANGNVVPQFADRVFKDCTKAGACGYYTYLAGTSMASPHVAGVAALIVAKYGKPDPVHGGETMNPDAVERQLYQSAAAHACPTPATRSYAQEGFGPEYDATCAGTTNFNGFYGHGIVDAYAAVGGRG